MATDVDSTSLIEFNMIPTFISDELVPGLHQASEISWMGAELENS